MAHATGARKIGVYVCTGCGIGEALDAKRLAGLSETELGAAITRTSSAFCLEDAQVIKDDVFAQDVDSVVIAACSQRVNTDVFAFEPAAVERVNIREQVAWSHAPGDAAAQAMAEDGLRMGAVRAAKRQPPLPFEKNNVRRVLVVGGGMAGMSAALDAADAGFDAVLVEADDALGGFAARIHRQYPKCPPYEDLAPTGIDGLAERVRAHAGIHVHTGARIAKVAGQPGRFEVEIANATATENVTAGAIVLATGWRVGSDDRLREYGLGRIANVITSAQLEEMARNGDVRRPSDGKAVETVALMLADARDDADVLPYSGNVASMVLLKQAVYLRGGDEGRHVYVIYRDLQTPGPSEYFYRHVQSDPGIMLTRAEDRRVEDDGDGRVVIELDDTLLGGRIRLAVDLLVLGTPMAPATPETDGLQLDYLQGEGMPVNRFGFAESNFVCFPYETRRTGVYSAGCVRKPMDLAESARDGAAAALKAIQCIEQSSAGAAVHPRVGDLTYPEILAAHCTQCGRCTEECPFGALELNPDRTPRVNPNRCRRCGICMGACPVQVISFADYSVDILSGMIRSAAVPASEADGEPRILVLACENDAYPAIDMAGIKRHRFSAAVRVVPVRCLGSVNRAMVTDALTHGYDTVALMGCKSGDDYQCHFIQGSELLETRMANIREVLERMAIEPERVRFEEVAITDADRIPVLFDDLEAGVRRLGLSPLRFTVA